MVKIAQIIVTILILACQMSRQLSAQTAPGGISSDLNYWLKADAGVTLANGQVSEWQNQTLTLSSVVQSDTLRQPSFTPNALNFNPAISFNVSGNDFDFLSTDDLVWDSDTVILVFNPNDVLASNVRLQGVVVYNIPNNQFGDAGIGIGSIGGSDSDHFFNSTDITPAESGEYIATSRVSTANTGDAIIATVRQDQTVNPTRSEHRFWGQNTASNIINLGQYASHQNTEFTIGQRDGGGLPFDGDVLEAISYSSRLGDASLRRIESYLAIKYGLTLNQATPQDYIDSSGNTIYDVDGVLAAYGSNIAGIGKDDSSGLNQKQSTSTTTNSVQANNSGLVTMGLGTIATTNALNPNSFTTDQTFMVWGNNAAPTRFDSELMLSPTLVLNRMQRVWAIQETGAVGDVKLTIPKSIFGNNRAPSLVISSDSTFAGESNVVTLLDESDNSYQAIINFNDGDFFTFAASGEDTLDDSGFYVTPLSNGNTVIFEL